MSMNKFNTKYCFIPGKLTTIIDGCPRSGGKGKLTSFITEHADNWQFCCNTFMPNASHWVEPNDFNSLRYFYQTFNSCAYNHNKFERIYIGQGAVIELKSFFRELEENKIPLHKIGVSPITSILQDIDTDYEKGLRSERESPRL